MNQVQSGIFQTSPNRYERALLPGLARRERGLPRAQYSGRQTMFPVTEGWLHLLSIRALLLPSGKKQRGWSCSDTVGDFVSSFSMRILCTNMWETKIYVGEEGRAGTANCGCQRRQTFESHSHSQKLIPTKFSENEALIREHWRPAHGQSQGREEHSSEHQSEPWL